MRASTALKAASIAVFLATSTVLLAARLTTKAAPALGEYEAPKRHPLEQGPPPPKQRFPIEKDPRGLIKSRAQVEEYLRAASRYQIPRRPNRDFERAIVDRCASWLEHQEPEIRIGLARLMTGYRAEDTLATRVALLRPLASEEAQPPHLISRFVAAGACLGSGFRQVILERIRLGLNSANRNARLNAARSLGALGNARLQRPLRARCGWVDRILFRWQDCEETWRALLLRIVESDGPEAGVVLGFADALPFYPLITSQLTRIAHQARSDQRFEDELWFSITWRTVPQKRPERDRGLSSLPAPKPGRSDSRIAALTSLLCSEAARSRPAQTAPYMGMLKRAGSRSAAA